MKAELIEAARACGLPVRVYATPPPPPVAEHEDCPDLLIATGWGDVDRVEIPPDVLRDAQQGREPRRNPHEKKPRSEAKAQAQRDLVRAARIARVIGNQPPRKCVVCRQDYQPNTIGETVTCGTRDCRLERSRQVKRARYASQLPRYTPRLVTRGPRGEKQAHNQG